MARDSLSRQRYALIHQVSLLMESVRHHTTTHLGNEMPRFAVSAVESKRKGDGRTHYAYLPVNNT